MKQHRYEATTRWTGNTGSGTSNYTGYSRDHEISAAGKQLILPGSSDGAFRGNAKRYNPEELLVASLSACHMLWYLHLCAANGIVVISYEDRATGLMEQEGDGGGRFTHVVLHPRVSITPESNAQLARDLHGEAHRLCFIANSVNFPVAHEPEILLLDPCPPSAARLGS